MDDYSNLEFDASEIPIKSVVCYRDQAEVFREFDVTLVAGTNKVVIEVRISFTIAKILDYNDFSFWYSDV